jgi:hypothetical protein
MPLTPEDEAILRQAEAEFDQKNGGAAQPAQSAPPALLGPPKRLPRGAAPPVIGTAPTGLKKNQAGPPQPAGFMEQLGAYPGWTGTALRAVVPQSKTEAIGDLLSLGMYGPEVKGAQAAGKLAPQALNALRALSLPKKLALGAGTGAAANYLQGQSPVTGGLQGGAQAAGGKVGDVVGNYFGERAFAKAAAKEDPKDLAGPITQSAPWLANIIKKPSELWNHLDFKRLFQQPSGEKLVGNQFRNGLRDIENQARRATGNTPAFGSPAMEALDPDKNKGRMIPLREAFDTIQDLRSGGYVRGIEAKGGMSAARLRDIRNQLVDETQDYLDRISNGTLGAQYADLRKQMGRSMAFMRVFNAKDIVQGGKINMALAQERWLNQKPLGLDIESWLDQPGEFESVENTLFRGGDPTTPDVAPQSGGMHVYATPSLKPHGYFKLGKPGSSAGFPGSRFGGAAGAGAVGRGIGGLQGEWAQKRGQTQDVVMPDTPGVVTPGGEIPPEVLQLVKSHPELQGLSDDELRALYEQTVGAGR